MKYKIQTIIDAYNTFIATHDREPTAIDFDSDPNLPGARYIQRNYGGLKAFRKEIGAHILDHTTGAARSRKAKEALERAQEYEREVINKLFNKYHDSQTFNPTVTRHLAYQQYLPDGKNCENIKCDVALSYRNPGHVVLFDFFYPSTKQSLYGCVNSKRNKLEKNPPAFFDCTHEIVLVCMNPDIEITDLSIISDSFKTLSYRQFVERFLDKTYTPYQNH